MNNNYETAIIHWTLKLSGLGGGWLLVSKDSFGSAAAVSGQQGRVRVGKSGFGSAEVANPGLKFNYSANRNHSFKT